MGDYTRYDPPNFNQASDGPKIGGKSIGMDIDEFTCTSPQTFLGLMFNRVLLVKAQHLLFEPFSTMNMRYLAFDICNLFT